MCKYICREKILIRKHSSVWGKKLHRKQCLHSEIKPSNKEKQHVIFEDDLLEHAAKGVMSCLP